MTGIAEQIFESAPMEMRQRPPIPRTIEDLQTRVSYFEFWVQKANEALALCETDDERRLWDRLKRANEKKLKAAQESLTAGHYCECCGLLLTKTSGPIGPECEKHPNEFPCKSKRRVH
jgi:hypothetical protein